MAQTAKTQSHTQGPWEFCWQPTACTIVSTRNRPGSSVRASLRGVVVVVEAAIPADPSKAVEVSPDARLIVAAPDLLVALNGLIDAIDFEGNGSIHFSPGTAYEREVLTIARAAVAKAVAS